MSAASTKPPSGMRDFLPDAVRRRRHVVGIVEAVYERYGFVPLETPSIENLSTLLGKYGDEGDQLLYRLLHRRDALARALEKDGVSEADLADQGLRYDLTVPLARVVAQYGDLPRFFKRYQIQPVWRADRPGRGRFREFYQCDVDITGTESLVAEAEVCAAVCETLEALGFDDFVVRLNHRRLLREAIRASGVDDAREETALVAIDKLDKIGRDGVLAELEQRDIARGAGEALLDLLTRGEKNDEAAELARLREGIASDTGRAAIDELAELLELSAGTPARGHLRVDATLARGLGYYTGPIFEIAVADLAGSLGGGGRYDGLVGMFSKRDVPAVGFSLGLERILLILEERGLYPELPAGPELLLCLLDVSAAEGLSVASALRKHGLRVELYPEKTKKLGKQLQYADSIHAKTAGILGKDELASGELTIKFLASGEQLRTTIDGAVSAVRAERA